MVNFERSFKRDNIEIPSKPSDTFFPHTLHLDMKDVEALGLKDVEVGAKMTLISKVEVSSISIREENDTSKKRHSVQLRLLEGEIEKPKASSADHAKKLFGSKE